MSNFWGGFFQLFFEQKKKEIENIHNEKKMRSLILTHSVQAKMPEALDRAGKYFQDLKKSQKSVPADFRWASKELMISNVFSSFVVVFLLGF